MFANVGLVLLLKVRWPARVWLLRGNHESRQVSQVYGFYDECLRKFGGPEVWLALVEVFDWLPLAASVDGRFFCPHAGLSPSLDSTDQIQAVNRVRALSYCPCLAFPRFEGQLGVQICFQEARMLRKNDFEGPESELKEKKS